MLERLRPKLAAIEVGVNTYGHPAPPTLAALKRAGVRVYRTDRDGTVTLSVEGGEMHVTTEHDPPEAPPLGARRLAGVADLKPAYLVCGDDDAKIDAWRSAGAPACRRGARPGGLETFDARQTDPEEVAAALGVLSFDTGTRYLLVDDVVAWKAGQLGPLEALALLPPETVLVLIARGKAAQAALEAVQAPPARCASTRPRKPWQLPKWCVERAAEARPSARSGRGEGARGPRRAESTAAPRELEKIGLALHPSMNVTLADVEELAASDNAPQVYDLADALVAG